MKTFLLTITSIIYFSITSNSIAAVNCNSVGNTCSGPAKELIDQFFVVESGESRLLLITSSSTVSNTPYNQGAKQLDCVPTNGGMNLRMSDTNLAFEENYTIILASFISNSDIAIRIDENESDCTVSNIRLQS